MSKIMLVKAFYAALTFFAPFFAGAFLAVAVAFFVASKRNGKAAFTASRDFFLLKM